MGVFLIILLIIFVTLPLWRGWAQRLVMRYMQRKAEDYIRKAAGMPPRDKKKKGKRTGQSSDAGGYANRGYYRDASSEPIIPKEYAEDVEFTEVKEFSEVKIRPEDETGRRTIVESQVSDVEWEEVKVSKRS